MDKMDFTTSKIA